MSQVFLSYATKDAFFSELAEIRLKNAGIKVWIDQGKIRAGEEWRNAIDEGIASSDVLVVVLTPQSCQSPYVTYEWAFALGKGIKVIPVLLEDADIHPRLAVLQYMDFRDQKNSPWEELFQQVLDNSAPPVMEKDTNFVRDLTVHQFQELISGVVSLANATVKSAGPGAEYEPRDMSRTAKSMLDMMQQTSGPQTRSAGSPGKHILWVDDRPENNLYERDAFKAMGISFTLALSTNEALEKIAKQRFAAIISDMGRKEGPKEGYVLLEKVRSNEDETPFFIYAGSSSEEHKQLAKKRGAQGTTNHPQELFEMVTQVIS